ncbi:MAG: AAA family ATPase [Clostridia bacterium]
MDLETFIPLAKSSREEDRLKGRDGSEVPRQIRLEEEIKDKQISCTHVPLTYDDIAQVVESWTKIPVQKLTSEEADKLLHLEERLHQRVIGQEAAVSALSRAIRRNRSGFRKEKKPASFIFAGPTGVGKTELVKTLAQELFGTEDALIRIDMSEYMEKHTVSKLIGAPPGYVGYDQGGQLTEKVRRRPYCVILLDEIEKAHADVFNMLLQILDDGRLTDKGLVVNFENTIIVMTTNAGASFKNNGLGFNSDDHVALSERIQSALKEFFRPEFLNRIDEIITFEPLTKPQLRRIVDLMLKDVYRSGQYQNIHIEVADEVKEYLAETGYDAKYGARPLRRLIQRTIEDEIAEAFLRGEIGAGDAIVLYLRQDHRIEIEKKAELV